MAYLIISSIIWAFSFGLIGNVLKGLDPLMVASARLVIAVLVFLPLLRPGQLSRGERSQLAAIGAVQFGIMYLCYISAFRFIPSHQVALFSVLTPIYVVLIHDLREGKFHAHYLLAALLSVAGAAVIKARSGATDSIWIGFGLMQVSGIAFAFGQVAYRDWKQAHSRIKDHEIFCFLYAGGALTALLVSLLITPAPADILNANATQFGVIIYLGAVASGLGFFLWNKGATRCTPGVLGASNNLLVPMAIFVSLFVFGEIKDASASELGRLLLGATLISTAVLVGKASQGAKSAS